MTRHTIIETNCVHLVRIITDYWENDLLWLEMECGNASIHAIITPDETKRVIEGLQKVLTWMEARDGKT
jgi:hypothetical protein